MTERFRILPGIKKNDIHFVQNMFFFPPSYEGGIQAGKQIASMQNMITAAVTTADICAIGIMEGARLGGYRVPIELSVIGYDNLKLCQYTVPEINFYFSEYTQKALLATKFLLERIRTGK